MRTPFPKEQLFEGAIIRCKDMDTFTAVVHRLDTATVTLLDIYAGLELVALYEYIYYCSIAPFILQRLGFKRIDPNSSTFVLDRADLPHEVLIQKANGSDNWKLLLGNEVLYTATVNGLQTKLKNYCGVLVTVDSFDEDADPDYTSEL